MCCGQRKLNDGSGTTYTTTNDPKGTGWWLAEPLPAVLEQFKRAEKRVGSPTAACGGAASLDGVSDGTTMVRVSEVQL